MPILNSLGALNTFKTTSILRPGRSYFPNTVFPNVPVVFEVTGTGVNNLKNPVQTPGYTIEAWIRPVGLTVGVQQCIGNFVPGFGFGWSFTITSTGKIVFNFAGFSYSTTNSVISSGSWSYITVTFVNDGTNSTIRLFHNGNLENIQLNGTGTSSTSKTFLSSNSTHNNSYEFNFGPTTNAPSMQIYYSEVRISNVARYTTSFTQPYQPFVSDANTLALYHFDYNVLQGATSTIIDSGPYNFTNDNYNNRIIMQPSVSGDPV